jgi:two-component system, OmpR family, response regulator
MNTNGANPPPPSDPHEHDAHDVAAATGWAGKKIFTTGEAAEVCKVSQQTIIRCFDSGRLHGFRVPGSKFRRIPREELIRFMKANSIPTDNLEGLSQDQGRKRILVVDDDPGIVDLFIDILNRDGRFEVQSATSGYDAGMLTESFRPHLIVLDYMLPDVNGNIVCAKVRANPELADTRIIFVSGVVNQQEIQQLLAAGADAFFKKPFELSALMSKINHLLALENGQMAGR